MEVCDEDGSLIFSTAQVALVGDPAAVSDPKGTWVVVNIMVPLLG